MTKLTVIVGFLVLEIISSLGRGGIVQRVQGQLSQDFYSATCPGVEEIVRSRLTTHSQTDVAVPAHLLRLQFHDCAATGCDASLLLTGPNSEQDARPNLTLLGFDVIDDIKAQVEVACPGVVSCADIMAMCARDAVFLSQGPDFRIPLGRFDSTFSGGSGVSLPSPDDSVVKTLAFFQTMGLDATDLVALNGAHTIGVAHCSSLENRLYDFNNVPNTSDPTIAPSFRQILQLTCPRGDPDNTTFVALDQGTLNVFDNQFFSEVAVGKGVLGLDEELSISNLTSKTMAQMSANQTDFFETFAASLIKMGMFNVSDKTTGNIRSKCSVVGSLPASPGPTTGSVPVTASSPADAPAPSFANSPDSPFDEPADAPAPVAGG